MPAGPRRHRDRIAVVGGRIGGLAAAAFLRRAGLAATVYEQASALGEVGAGLVVARYERVRSPRAGRVQEASRGRIAHHHLPDGPERWPGTRRSSARTSSATTTGSTAMTPSRPRPRRLPGEFSIGSAPHRDPGSTRFAFAGHIRR
jgi:hypothetical protein